jgi:hypothetical protein
MTYLWRKALEKWRQFRIEVRLRATETLSLVVNLAMISAGKPDEAVSFTVFVDSAKDAWLIRTLRGIRLLPASEVVVVSGVADLLDGIRQRSESRRLSVVASRLFLKHYQRLAEARRRGLLVIV